jgi:hypothetical protein
LKRILPAGLLVIFTSLVIITGAIALNWKPAQSESQALNVFAGPAAQGSLPVYGWSICQDMGIGYVSVIGENRQRFVVCNGAGWRLNAYCLQPGIDPPLVGTICSITNQGNIWCGDNVQQLREYQMIETPSAYEETFTPTPTATATFTLTPTFTPSPTSTFTPSPTNTPTDLPTSTLTALPSFTPTVTPLPELTLTARFVITFSPTPTNTLPVSDQVISTATPTPTATVYRRPQAGGPGNKGIVFGTGFGLFALAGIGGVLALLRKRN